MFACISTTIAHLQALQKVLTYAIGKGALFSLSIIRTAATAQAICCNLVIEEILTYIRGTFGYVIIPYTKYSLKKIDDTKTIQTMKSLLILLLVSAVSAAPQNPQDVQILRYESNNAGLDSYNFVWETSDGSKHEEQGQLNNQGTENEGIEVRGEYGWIGPDGVTYLITYVADENGFKPQIQQGPGGAVPSAVIASLLG